MANDFRTIQRKFKFVPSLTPKRLEYLHYMASNSTARLIHNTVSNSWSVMDWDIKGECYESPLRWDTAETLRQFMLPVPDDSNGWQDIYQLNPEAQFTGEWLAAELKRQADERRGEHDAFVHTNEVKAEQVKAKLWGFIHASGDSFNDIVLDTSHFNPKLGYPEGGIFVTILLDGVKYRVYVESESLNGR